MHKVFVYGTLKRGHNNNRLLAPSLFVGEAVTVDNLCMLHAGIPYVARAGDIRPYLLEDTVSLHEHRVLGEVYECDDASLRRLDMLEGYSPDRPKEHNHYVREEIKVLVGPPGDPEPEEVAAFIYLGTPRRAAHCADSPVLPNGHGLLVYPGFRWEDEDNNDEDNEDEFVEPEDQDQGDVLGLDDEREQP